MIRFIFTMLFYGAFLGCLAILCMWFFLGMTVQQSIDWLKNKVGQTQSVVVESAQDVSKTMQGAGTIVDRQIQNVAKELK